MGIIEFFWECVAKTRDPEYLLLDDSMPYVRLGKYTHEI